MSLNKTQIEQNTYQETRNMDEEHTRGTIIKIVLQMFVFIYVFVHIYH